MKIQKRYRVELGDARRITFVLVGCGGTGSFAALHLARLAWSARQANIKINLAFVDPDVVEEKNVGRQNFCPAEIGAYKATSLAVRYSLAFGLAITGVSLPLAKCDFKFEYDNKVVLVGAVDSPAARREIDTMVRQLPIKTWWLDAGNNLNSGQVLIGNSPAAEPGISPLGVCVSLPFPSVQEPGIIDPDSPLQPLDDGLSCAELTALNAQSLMINQAMAGWLGVYAYRLALGRDLDIMATYVDLRSGSTRSKPITQGKVLSTAEVMRAREDDDDGWQTCPDCGGDLIEGVDNVDIAEVQIIFCDSCSWRMTLADFLREAQ